MSARLASRNARITLGLAVLGPTYSIYDVTRPLLLARELDLVASMHVAGVTPVSPDGFKQIVADDLISDKTNIVHGNDLTDEELRELTERGVQFTVTADVELQMGFGNPLTGRLRVLGAPMSWLRRRNHNPPGYVRYHPHNVADAAQHRSHAIATHDRKGE